MRVGHQRPDWDDWAMGLARAVARRADCTRRQVGAVILDREHRVVSTGYNGAPPGKGSCMKGECPRGQRSFEEIPAGAAYDVPGSSGFCVAVHAETNAILLADRSRLPGSTLYVTDGPCVWCEKLIQATRIGSVVFPSKIIPHRLEVKLV